MTDSLRRDAALCVTCDLAPVLGCAKGIVDGLLCANVVAVPKQPVNRRAALPVQPSEAAFLASDYEDRVKVMDELEAMLGIETDYHALPDAVLALLPDGSLRSREERETTPTNDALRGYIAVVEKIAREASAAWDADNDSRVGKLLGALCGKVGYRLDLDEARAALAASTGGASPRTAVEHAHCRHWDSGRTRWRCCKCPSLLTQAEYDAELVGRPSTPSDATTESGNG